MRKYKDFIIILILGISIILGSVSAVTAQISATDLSSVKVDDYTDAQIQSLMKKASLSGLSEAQLEATAAAQGMSSTEIAKLKERIATIKNSASITTTTTDSEDDIEDEVSPVIVNTNTSVASNSQNFGFSLFTTKTLSFEPSTNIATPQNYQLGPGDKLIIDIWGASQETYKQKITSEGSIIISNLGPIYISGMTIEEATVKIKKELSSIYSGLLGGNTFMKVSLSSARSIKVNIVGDVAVPGTYTLSSLSTVFNALYIAGGPSESGSLRDVKIIRGNKTVAELDFYEFLLKGILPNNMRLQDEDIVFVSTYLKRVKITGKMKRTGMFDLKPTETLKDLIYFTGGFNYDAYSDRIGIIRKTGKQNKILDVSFEQAETFTLNDGDDISVGEVLSLYENRVEISGSVWRQGYFSIDSTMTLKQLIDKADGLKGDAFLKRVLVYRILDDLSTEVISIDISDTTKAEQLFLIKDDKVVISSIYSIQEAFVFNISGEVKVPGSYPYTSNTTVEDLIMRAGGLLQSATSAQLEVARRIIDKTSLSPTDQLSEIFTFSISKDLALSDSASKFILQPFDQVFIRKSPSYSDQELIEIKGEVLFPGFYSLMQKNERVSDLLKRAGGLTPEAYLKGARLIRKITNDKKIQLEDIEAMKLQVGDSINSIFLNRTLSSIDIDLRKIINNPGSKYDLLLKKDDILYLPKVPQTIGLSGALIYPIVTRYDKKYNLRKYIANTGGYSQDAKKSKVYVVYFNGSVKKTSKILFFNNYPKIEPGAEIIVPYKKKQGGIKKTDAIGFGSAAASFALIVVYLINALSK